MRKFLLLAVIGLSLLSCNNDDDAEKGLKETLDRNKSLIRMVDSLQLRLDSCRSQPMQTTTGNNSPVIISDKPVKIDY